MTNQCDLSGKYAIITGSTQGLGEAEAAQPFGRLLKPTEVARAVAFMASDESGMMTGAIVDFD